MLNPPQKTVHEPSEKSMSWTIGRQTKRFAVLDHPTPHILVSSAKQLHGWWPGKRECTGERMLINPYNGCDFGCLYCYANWMDWGYFRLFRQKRIVTVFDKMDLNVAKQLDSVDVAACGYLSPVTDPFQPVNMRYKLSERIVRVFTERGLPIDIITKGIIPDGVIVDLAQNPHSFAQVSVTSVKEDLRRRLSPGQRASTDDLFHNLQRISSWPAGGRAKVHAVCRIDPILPFITDNKQELRHLVERAKLCGADHIVASCVDVSGPTARRVFRLFESLNPSPRVSYGRLFCERIDGALHADIGYRRDLFSYLKELCIANEVSFALCMEYEKTETSIMVKTAAGKLRKVSSRGLNEEFMTGCANCEGIDIPVYRRDFSGRSGYYIDHKGVKRPRFAPAAGCNGACLTCSQSVCGVEELAMGNTASSRKDFTLRDYRRWSKQLGERRQESLWPAV